jgi:IS30 family transposase
VHLKEICSFWSPLATDDSNCVRDNPFHSTIVERTCHEQKESTRTSKEAKTVTYDREKEMAEHERLAQRLAIRVFFADPYSPWQRGTNEIANGLLRQYLPKGTDLSGYTQRELNTIAHRLNTRPRRCLNWARPPEVFSQLRHHSPVAL